MAYNNVTCVNWGNNSNGGMGMCVLVVVLRRRSSSGPSRESSTAVACCGSLLRRRLLLVGVLRRSRVAGDGVVVVVLVRALVLLPAVVIFGGSSSVGPGLGRLARAVAAKRMGVIEWTVVVKEKVTHVDFVGAAFFLSCFVGCCCWPGTGLLLLTSRLRRAIGWVRRGSCPAAMVALSILGAVAG